jgi:hypothetical protein
VAIDAATRTSILEISPKISLTSKCDIVFGKYPINLLANKLQGK